MNRSFDQSAIVADGAPGRCLNPQPGTPAPRWPPSWSLGWSDQLAFLSEQSHFGFFRNRSKWLINNNLRRKRKVVKKRQLEKQSQFGGLSDSLERMSEK
jgi:hypothetical protein